MACCCCRRRGFDPTSYTMLRLNAATGEIEQFYDRGGTSNAVHAVDEPSGERVVYEAGNGGVRAWEDTEDSKVERWTHSIAGSTLYDICRQTDDDSLWVGYSVGVTHSLRRVDVADGSTINTGTRPSSAIGYLSLFPAPSGNVTAWQPEYNAFFSGSFAALIDDSFASLATIDPDTAFNSSVLPWPGKSRESGRDGWLRRRMHVGGTGKSITIWDGDLSIASAQTPVNQSDYNSIQLASNTDKLAILFDGPNPLYSANTLSLIDLSTFATDWTVSATTALGFSAFATSAMDADHNVYLYDSAGLSRFNGSDGSIEWSVNVPSSRLLVYGSLLICVRVSAAVAFALDTETGDIVWSNPHIPPQPGAANHVNGVQLLGDKLYICGQRVTL